MDELSDIPEVENHIATLDTEVKGFAEGLPYWAKYLAEKILSCNAITDIEINLFWFSVNWRIRPFELECKNGGNHHAQTAKKLHANREGLRFMSIEMSLFFEKIDHFSSGFSTTSR